MKIKSWFQKPREPTQQEKAIELIQYLKSQDYGFVYSSDLSMFNLPVVKNNISEYIGYLRKINHQLLNEEEIYPRNVNLKRKNVKLPLWYVVDNIFIEPTQYTLLLLDEAELFIQTYYKLDLKLDRNYTEDHNLRMVGSLCGDLLTLLKEIENVNTKSVHSGSQ